MELGCSSQKGQGPGARQAHLGRPGHRCLWTQLAFEVLPDVAATVMLL